MKFRHFHVRPDIPPAIQPLHEIAMNLWFSWNWEAVQLFIRLNPELWEKTYQNPVLMLGTISQEELKAAASDESFVANVKRVHENLLDYLGTPGWFRENHAEEKDFLVAYFSCEFGLEEGLPIYAGGLGLLAGDHLKAASDLGLPLAGVGLLYKKGYFRQVLSLDGWQKEFYPDNDWYNMPVSIERDSKGSQIMIEVDMAGEKVKARIWRAQIGRTPLYLLDSNIKENSPRGREITGTLYGGDRDMRIRQEILLGVGGVRALRALGLSPTVYHMNEGHSAFLAIERIRALMAEHGLSYPEAREHVFSTNVFTTHTPVPAGNEQFSTELVGKYLHSLVDEIGLPWQAFLSLGQVASSRSPDFGLTVLALRMAAFANGVSRLHSDVSKNMWRDLWPGLLEQEVPIHAITNGIHTRTWISHEMGDLFLRYLGPRFVEKPADHSVWERVEAIPPGELWRIHETRRERLVFFARKRLKGQLMRQGAGAAALRAAEEVLHPEALTIGFSRRFATYKRAGLLFRQPERLIRLLTDSNRPVQILFAGKAHPHDNAGRELIKMVIHFAMDSRIRHRMVFLEDYDINVARYMVQGSDVWLNTPRRPLEASGTSGMKAAANGALNVSTLDGWWPEGYALDTGWAIGSGEVYGNPEEQDHVECEALYNLLENEIVPLFYQRDSGGLPREWISLMKTSMRKLGAYFNTPRMIQEYTERFYLPAHKVGGSLMRDGFAGAKALGVWRSRVTEGWSRISVRSEETEKKIDFLVGSKMGLIIRANLGDLTPDDVSVEIYYGTSHSSVEIHDGFVLQARHERQDGSEHLFRAEIPCHVSGRYVYAARIVPRHPYLVNPYTPLLLTWEVL
jgi:starch phosphorylase